MSIEKACLHENDAEYERSFIKNESTITFDLEVELKQNFQYISFITFQIKLYNQILEIAKIPQIRLLDSFGKGLLLTQ